MPRWAILVATVRNDPLFNLPPRTQCIIAWQITIRWSFTDRVILLVLWCCYGQIRLLDVRISCTEPRFCRWGPSAPKKNDKPGYVRYNTFFHVPKNNEGESNLTLITWFPHRRPLYRWMRLIKRWFLVTGLVILKLTHSLIPAENPNSSKFNGTEGVGVSQYLNRYNKYIFEKTVPTISGRDLSYVGTDMNFRCVTRKGKWPFHLKPDTNSYVSPSSSKIPLPL